MVGRPDFQARNDLLGSLPPADFGLIGPALKEIPLRHGDVLLEPGERVSAIYFPLSGLISILSVMRSGEVVETGIVGRDGVCGALSALSSGHAQSRAVVQVGGSAARISPAQLLKAARESERLREVLRRHFERRLGRTQQLVACNALHTAEERFIRWLLQCGDLSGTPVITITQESIAQMLGVRRTTVTAIAHSLQRRGLIRYSRGRIHVADREKLRKFTCECYDAMRTPPGASSARSRRGTA